LKKYLTSSNFRTDLQCIIECCQSENNYAGGNINDVFYSLLNFIIIESVFIYRSYELMDELYSDINLVESGKILEEIEKKFDKFGNHCFFPMSPSLAKKLYKLDVHTSNKLHVNYVIYGDRIFEQLDVMSKLLAEKRDNGDTQVNLQHILDASEKCIARKVNNIKKVVKD